jgi:hypothetical protein
MPSWISNLGIWKPANEYAVNPNAERGKEVYSGVDRAATEQLIQDKVDHLGQSYKMNPDLIRMARELNFKDVDEYLLTMHGVDVNKLSKDAEEKIKNIVVDHKDPARKPASTFRSGGDDESMSGKGRKGGFETPNDVPSARI